MFAVVLVPHASAQKAPQPQPGDALQQVFEKFASSAGPMAPIFGKLAPEQLEQLERIKISQQQNQVAPWLQFVPGFIKSHPDAGKRAQAVSQIAVKNAANYPQAKYIGIEDLRTRIPRSVRKFPQ